MKNGSRSRFTGIGRIIAVYLRRIYFISSRTLTIGGYSRVIRYPIASFYADIWLLTIYNFYTWSIVGSCDSDIYLTAITF